MTPFTDVVPDMGTSPRVHSSPINDGLLRSPVELEVVIPAYNEASRITRTLRHTVDYLALQPWQARVVVVDNGSVDDTSTLVRHIASECSDRVPVALVGCSLPGKGAAVRRGLLSGTSRFTGFFDADMATPLETLAVAMDFLKGGAAAAIASRHAPGSTFVQPQPLGRRLGGGAFRMLVKAKVQGVSDTQCGFKFFERDAMTRAMVQCRTSGFAFDVELLQRLQCNGEQIIEIPVAWTDGAGSSFHPLRDGLASFAAVLQMHRLAS